MSEKKKNPEQRNFWNTCPRKLEYLPDCACPQGKESRNLKNEEKHTCPWGINSKKHNYCFWKFLYDNSNSDGSIDPMMQNEIAKLFGCSSTKIHFILKEAMEKLKGNKDFEEFKDFQIESKLNEDPTIYQSLDIPEDNENK